MQARNIRWHADADVVVIGYGAAGTVAAMTAHDGGAQVLVLEKQGSQGLITTSYMSGGGVINANDEQGAITYMEALAKVNDALYWTDPDTIRLWAQYSAENKKWLEGLGKSLKMYRHGGEHKVPGFEAIDSYHVPGLGPGLMRMLYGQVDRRGIQVLFDTQAIDLMTNSRGEVIGVQARSTQNAGHVVNIKSRRATILATGGFEFDEPMKLQYLRTYPTYFLGNPANTGDGIRLAMGVGAQLWHMNCCSARLVMKFPDRPFAFNPEFKGKEQSASLNATSLQEKGRAEEHGSLPAGAGYILVDRDGKRYTKETYKNHTVYYELTGFDSQRLICPRIPSYWIFDRKRIESGPLSRLLSGPAGPARLYKWSKDNSEEIGRGWIKQGDTIKELARSIGLDPQRLNETVRNYHRYCKDGKDREFDRAPATLAPLDSPPYYAVKLWPGGPNTQGGPRRNSKAQVVRVDGNPVPRLYSAGELGSIYGMLYPAGGGNLAECIAFGRIAGERACEEQPL